MIDRNNWKADLNERLKRLRHEEFVRVEEGWKDLICDLVDKLDETGIDWTPVCIKEKLGTLRFMVEVSEHPTLESILTFKDYGTIKEAAFLMISEAETKSEKTCEMCGKPGRMASVGKFLLKTLCHMCDYKIQETENKQQ